MPAVGILCEPRGEKVSFDECLECAATWENPCEFREPVLRRMVEAMKFSSSGEPSTTEITGCILNSFLKRHVEFWVKPQDYYWAFRGTLTHEILYTYATEKKARAVRRRTRNIKVPGGLWVPRKYVKGLPAEDEYDVKTIIAEERFGMLFPFDGEDYFIHGKVDLYIPWLKKLYDWKTAKTVPKYSRPYPGHQQQTNIYGRILGANDLPVEEIEINYMDMDQTKPLAATVWTQEAIDKFLIKRLVPYSQALWMVKAPPRPRTKEDGLWKCGYCEEEIQAVCDKLQKRTQIARVKVELCSKCPHRLEHEKAKKDARKKTGKRGSTGRSAGDNKESAGKQKVA